MNDRRTRVLLMASSMRGGGSEHQVALLAEHLSRDHFEIHLYLTHRVGELMDRLPQDLTIHSPDIQPASFVDKVLNRWPGRILRDQARSLNEVLQREKIDVVYDRAFHNTLIAGHEAVTTPVRRVSTMVSPPHLALPSVEKRFVELKRRRLADAYQRSTAVVAVSGAVADSAASYYGLSREKIFVIRNPVALAPSFDPPFAAVEPEPDAHDRSADTLRLVCVGRMSREKGQSDLVEAMLRLPNPWPPGLPRFQLDFIGDGPLRSQIEARVGELTGGTRTLNGHEIRFRGIISPATSEIASADGLVCPSHFEGMPNVVLEAFSMDVPVIATQSGGTAELQQSPELTTCFWAQPAAPDSLAKALFDFAENPQRRHQNAVNAMAWVQKNHTISRAIEEISNLLRHDSSPNHDRRGPSADIV